MIPRKCSLLLLALLFGNYSCTSVEDVREQHITKQEDAPYVLIVLDNVFAEEDSHEILAGASNNKITDNEIAQIRSKLSSFAVQINDRECIQVTLSIPDRDSRRGDRWETLGFYSISDHRFLAFDEIPKELLSSSFEVSFRWESRPDILRIFTGSYSRPHLGDCIMVSMPDLGYMFLVEKNLNNVRFGMLFVEPPSKLENARTSQHR